MSGTVRATGQGVTADFRYTGSYDVIDFGAVTLNAALGLINALPPFSKEAFDAGLCPPAITLTDPSGNSLTIYRSVGGGFNVCFTGPRTGNVLSNAELGEVRDLIIKFLAGTYPEVTDEVSSDASGGEIELLAFMPLYVHYDEFALKERQEINLHVWRKVGEGTYLEIDAEGGGKIRLPLNHVIEVTFKRGGFLRGAKVEIKFVSNDGQVRKLTRRIDGRNKEWIPKVVARLSQVMPGRVRVE